MKNIIRKVLFSLAAFTMIFGSFSFAACHEHTPAEAVRENEVAATCKKTGSYDEVVYCLECNEEISRTKKKIPKIPHTPAEELSSNKNGHWTVCTECGEDGEVEDHVPGPEATEETSQICTVCNYVLAPPIGHVHVVEEVKANAATCTQAGNKAYYKCNCGKWFADADATEEIDDHGSVTISKLGHKWDDGVVKGDKKIYTCENGCGETREEDFKLVGAEYLVPHSEGQTVTYMFEAECTSLAKKEGVGWSGTYPGSAMAIVGNVSGVSNTGAVSSLYKYGITLNFIVISDRDVNDATLYLRCGAEYIDFTLTAQTFGVRIDPVSEQDLKPVTDDGAWGAWDDAFIKYYDNDNPNGKPFKGYWLDEYACKEITIKASDAKPKGKLMGLDDYLMTTALSLKAGANCISFVTLNRGNNLGGTLEAVAPVVDGIKIVTKAQLGLYNPQDNGFGAKNAAIV